MSPLTFGAPDPVAGISAVCPPLRSYWYEGVSAPVPGRLVVARVADITVVSEALEGGEATAAIVVDEDGTPGFQVTIERTGVWDVVMVDSFDADPGAAGSYLCPLVDPGDPLGSTSLVYFGRGDADGVLRLTRGHQELGATVVGVLRPNVIAPAGIDARCLFRNLYVATEGPTGGLVRITPVVDGEVLTDEQVVFAARPGLHRYEVPLSRAYDVTSTERSRAGIVGTWFTVEIEVLDAFGCGRLELGGIEVEFDVLEQGIPQDVFTGESGTVPLLGAATQWYMGGVGAAVWHGRDGTDDAGAAIPVRLQTNDMAPAGAGGECIFTDVYLAVTRRNTSDWTFTLTPIVDGVALEGTDVTLLGAADPLTEVVAISLAQPFLVGATEVSRYEPRGAWIALRITAASAPDDEVIFAGPELEYDVLAYESLEDVTNA